MEASTANEPAASGTPTPSLGDAAAKRTRSSARPGSSRWACCGIATSTLWLAAFGASVGTWMEMIGVQWVMAQPRSIRRDEPQADRRPHHDGLPGRGPTRPTLVLGWWAGSPRIASTPDAAHRPQVLLMLVAGWLAVTSGLGIMSPTPGSCRWSTAWCWRSTSRPGRCSRRASSRIENSPPPSLNGMQFNLARVVGPAAGAC